MKQQRFFHIDFLRAVAVLAFIVTHVFSYHLTNPFNEFVWNYSHFQIVAFVFCSGYVMYFLYKDAFTTVSQIFSWYAKRLTRLILPFYYYLFFHYILLLLFPAFFSGPGLVKSADSFFQSVMLFGGVNTNWLPLLFVELALLFPVLLLLQQKKLLLIYAVLSFSSLIFFSIVQFPYAYYRFVMWFPWSCFFLLAWYFAKQETSSVHIKKYLMLSAIGGITFIFLFFLWHLFHKPLNLIDNKYPPNLFDASYEACVTFFLTAIGFCAFWQKLLISSVISFISRNSYSLFFVHYIVADFFLSLQKILNVSYNVFEELLLVILVSLAISYILEKTMLLIRKVPS
ncbi:MAG TPA: acyltransferase family protein [Patescibacteria group bacterium]|nr:acyltransferase family protein [Patescibacteria group bacterium]